jgi:hypothetical protein
MLSVIMLRVIMLRVIMLSVIMLSVIMLSVIITQCHYAEFLLCLMSWHQPIGVTREH